MTARTPVIATEAEVVAELEPGATIGIGGVINNCHPMAIVREIIRRGVGDLSVVGLASGLEVDMLIAAGLVRRVSTPTVSAETLRPIAPAFRRAAQTGELDVWEGDEGMIYAALQAAAQRVPFAPWPVGRGSSLPEINEDMVEIEAPFGGERVIAIKAQPLDVAFIHAARSDEFGNVQAEGSGYGDRALARAATRVVCTVDEIVSNAEIRRTPGATLIAGVDHVVHAPHGAHPFASPGRYIHDADHLCAYLAACDKWVATGDRTALDSWFRQWVDGPADHAGYLARVGARHLDTLDERRNTPPARPPRPAADLKAPYGIDELRACVIARDLRDGERGFMGANSGLGQAAVLLAHQLHAPNMKVLLAFSWTNLLEQDDIDLSDDSVDHRNARWAEGWMELDTMINSYRFFSDFFVIGALQIDGFGNSNLIGIGDDHRHLKLRGPGTMGSVSSTGFCNRFYLAPARHDKRVFVERCDFVSAVGWGAGGTDGRAQLGLPGGGPALCVTPLCVFDFDEETRGTRLRSVHDGATVEQVLEHTGFEVIVPADVPVTEPPSPEELNLLRTVIDPHGALRGG